MPVRRILACLTLGLSLGLALAPLIASVQAQPARSSDDEGLHVYREANCMGCHKWHGDGGGGYGGDALSLRKTQLTRGQIIETVSCGRPGTGMPYHLRDAYDGHHCFDATAETLGRNTPPEGLIFLRPAEIAAVADYVIAHIKGKGEPSYADCIAFWGEGSRICHMYQTAR